MARGTGEHDVVATLPRILLASRSPRRTALLRDRGVAHEAVHPGFDDAALLPGDVTPEQWVAALAYLKAEAGRRLMATRPDAPRVIVGADTACVAGDCLIGTPIDEPDAERILRRLVGATHRVVTGVAVIDSRGPGEPARRLFVSCATVRLGAIDEATLREYLGGGAWRGKAGAYNLGERLEAGWPIDYQGDPTGIMGLPMDALLSALARPIGASRATVAGGRP